MCHVFAHMQLNDPENLLEDTIRGMQAPRLSLVFIFVCGLGRCLSAQATEVLEMPSVFSDRMVLQSGTKVPVWGWAKPGAKVSIALAGQRVQAIADTKGHWRTDLASLDVGGPHEMVVTGGKTIRISDVLVGEVWLGSGQSNMAMRVNSCQNSKEEMVNADYPKIRMFTVKRAPNQKPQRNCEGSWVVCSPDTVKGFSGTAYFFGRRLHKELSVPVGLINSSVGGTPVESWTGMQIQREEPQLGKLLKSWHKRGKNWQPVTNAQFKKTIKNWQKRVENAKAKGKRTPRRPRKAQDPTLGANHPANLFNGMIHPLIPYRIRGALWYQGERNSHKVETAQLYRVQLPLLIADWRTRWSQGDFPFIFVQLPNYKKRQTDPNHLSTWAVMRESMAGSLAVPNTGMATTIDVGMARDIHPKNKQAVGSRLAQWALAKVYGRSITASGPMFAKAEYRDGSAYVSFQASPDALRLVGEDPLKGFAIAGEDRVFQFAKAEIRGKQVRVWHPSIAAPVAVRYAFGDNPDCNLANSTGLPAVPFRSDSWELK